MNRYIVRKFIRAESMSEALAQEPSAPIGEIYIDEKTDTPKADAVGFKYVDHYDPDEYWGKSKTNKREK